MSDEIAVLEVGFAVNLDPLSSAGSSMDSIFSSAASAAEASGIDITSSMEKAAESFSSITDAAMGIAPAIEMGVSKATEELETLPGAGEKAASSLSESIEGASSGFHGLQEAILSLTDSVNSAVSEIDTKIESIGVTAEESAEKTQGKFNGLDLSGMVSTIGMTIFSLQAIGQAASDAAGQLLGPAEAAENTQASFTNLMGSSKTASDELGKLNDFASKTQFKTQDIDNMAAKMIAFKTPTSDVIPEITAVGDALTAIGKGTPDELNGVIDTLGKMGIAGHISQGDISDLGSHGIDAFNAILKGSGMSKDALQDMIDKGTLPAGDAVKYLTQGIEKNPVYSGGMAKQAQTLSGQMSTLSSDFDQVMASALKPALPELEKDLSKVATFITSPDFKKFATTMGTDIAGGVKGVVDIISTLIDTGKGLVDFFTNNQTASDALYAGLIAIGAVILAIVVPAFIAWTVAMAPVVLGAIIAAAPFILLGLVVGAVVFGIIMAIQHWSEIMSFIGGVVNNVMGGVGSFFGGVGNKIQGIFGAIGGAAKSVGDGIAGAFKGAVNGVITGLNWLINAVDSFHVSVPPLVVAGVTVFGGVDLGLPAIPTIPYMAKGGTVGPGQAFIAGDAGPELVYGGTNGASVLNASSTSALMNGGGGGETHIHNHIYLDGREMTNTLMTHATKIIRGQGGKMVNI